MTYCFLYLSTGLKIARSISRLSTAHRVQNTTRARDRMQRWAERLFWFALGGLVMIVWIGERLKDAYELCR